MNWLYYLLEANLYLAVFYGFYRLLLHKETFYELNRYYLITAVLLAFLLPILQIGYLNQVLDSYNSQNLRYVDPKLTDITVNKTGIPDTSLLLINFYMIIAAAFLIRLGYNLYRVLLLAFRSKKQRHGKIVYIELNNTETAFSFFNLLFINPSIHEKNTILKHEMVHIRQRHSIDILFFEFVQVLSWFNPVTFLIKKDIKLLHEYIADEITTKSEVLKHDYAMFLIQNSFGNNPSQLTNQIFNQSILKRRINMLNKERSAGRTRLRLLYVLPVAGLMLCASSIAFTKEYAVIDLYGLKNQPMVSTAGKAVQQDKKYFFIKDNEKRLLVLNGKKLERKGIITIEGFDKMVELNGKTATEKYGTSAANGAVEFSGANTLATNKFPPPIVKPDVPEKVASAKVIKFPPPIVKPDAPEAPKKPVSAKKIKFPPPIVTKDVPPPPPPAPPKPKSTAVKFEGKNTKEEVIKAVEAAEPEKVYIYSIKEAKAVNADMEGIKQVRINANKDKNATTTFSYQISEKPEKAVEKVKSDLKEVKIEYVEKEKEVLKPVKKD